MPLVRKKNDCMERLTYRDMSRMYTFPAPPVIGTFKEIKCKESDWVLAQLTHPHQQPEKSEWCKFSSEKLLRNFDSFK